MRQTILLFFLATSMSFAQDQSLIYASYLGGSGQEGSSPKVTGKNGKWAVLGSTESLNMPTLTPFQANHNGGITDNYISVFDEYGQQTFGTYFGGTGSESGTCAVRITDFGYILIGGNTDSHDLPVTGGAHDTMLNGETDGFLALLSESGELQFCTYFGGNALDNIRDVEYDQFGNFYLAGRTSSPNLATEGAHKTEVSEKDAFLAKFNSEGDLMWSTYFGGENVEVFRKIEVSNDGQKIYCVGSTTSSSGINFNGWQETQGSATDGLLTCFNTLNGSVNWSTYYGGEGGDYVFSLACTDDDKLAIVGQTSSDNNIASIDSYQSQRAGDGDLFVALFDENGQREWGTYLGGTENEYPQADIIVQNNEIIVQGYTLSPDNIAVGNPMEPIFIPNIAIGHQSFLSSLSLNGNLNWGTYFMTGQPGGAHGLASVSNEKFAAVGTITPEGIEDMISPDAYQSSYGGSNRDYTLFIFKANSLSAENISKESLSIYPNPAQNQVTISRIDNQQISRIDLRDMAGKLVLSSSELASNKVNLGDHPPGVYIISATFASGEIATQKLVIQP